MKFAYADPPYIGSARRRYGPDAREVDHRLLIDHLERDFDGWALSCSTPSLRDLLPLCPPKVRVLAWVKTWVAGRMNVEPRYAWEPVLLRPFDRRRGAAYPHVFDWTSSGATNGRGVAGAKPESFAWWLFACADLQPDDELDDLFPGSGAIKRAWQAYRRQPNLLARPLGWQSAVDAEDLAL